MPDPCDNEPIVPSSQAPTGPLPPHEHPEPTPDPIPTVLGQYRPVRLIGKGGMGIVYEAEQQKPRRMVALKVIRAGYLSPQLLRRFEYESLVLGRLQHPGIAQVYEAGTVQGERGQLVPFFAMEFIRGVSLTEYAKQKNLGTRERLDLVARICDAVYHAHQKGVIHRDLKPGNILVDESGQPKVLDFGVARATDSDVQNTTVQTDIGQLIGTVPYMSPEQVSGDSDQLDTRSDVYALGIIAYELLTGRLPYDLSNCLVHEAVRVIKEEEPTRLSSVDRALRGDIETIVAKALEKDKSRRYQSAESLASDIRHHLNDEPIAARPASSWYQATKFAKRNRVLMAGVAAVLVALIIGLATTVWQARRADDRAAAATIAEAEQRRLVISESAARKEADSKRGLAERTSGFLADIFKGVGPAVAGNRDTAVLKELMDGAAAKIDAGELKDAPEAELILRITIGGTYRDIAEFDPAERTLKPTIDQARALASPGPSPDTSHVSTSLDAWATYLQAVGRTEEAVPFFRQALEMDRRLHQGDHPAVAMALNNLALALRELGQAADAESLLTEALEMDTRLSAGDAPAVAGDLDNLGFVLQDLGRYAEAEAIFQRALEMNRRLFKGDHPAVAVSLGDLASAHQDLGNAAEALPLLEEALAMTRRLHRGDHPAVANAIEDLARAQRDLGRAADAEPLLQEALALRQRLGKGDYPGLATTLNELAAVRYSLGRLPEAESMFGQSLEMNQRLRKGDHPEIAKGLNNVAQVRMDMGRPADAQPLLQQAVDMMRRLSPEDHPLKIACLINLARCRAELGHTAEALDLAQEGSAMARRILPEGHPGRESCDRAIREIKKMAGEPAPGPP